MAYQSATALEPDLQKLIDARLDTIDRMLMGRVPRADRQSILREVESQIEELVSQKDSGALGTAEILEVLTRLDPPEAYLIGEGEEESKNPSVSRFSNGNRFQSRREISAHPDRLAMTAGIVGILSLVLALTLTPAATMIAVALESEAALNSGLILSTIIGIVSGTSALIAGLFQLGKGAWPIVAIATGAVAIIASIILPAMVYFIV